MACRELAARLVTLDKSAVVALMDDRDPDHHRVRTAFIGDRGPYIVPAGVLAELGYLIECEFGSRFLAAFVEDLANGRYLLDCGDQDLERMLALIRRYDDLPLGLADAAVIACAERNGGQVLTLDLRHFGVVAREQAITVVP
jgi:predicted nucleic acid-binding protein